MTNDRIFNRIMEAVQKENAIIKIEELITELEKSDGYNIAGKLKRILRLLKNDKND